MRRLGIGAGNPIGGTAEREAGFMSPANGDQGFTKEECDEKDRVPSAAQAD